MRERSNAAPGLPAEKHVNPGGGCKSGYLEIGFVNVLQ